jgi:heme/copper-type cytochrome/quinol oxidase subunit 2
MDVLLFNLRGILMVVCLVLIGGAFVAMCVSSWLHHRANKTEQPNFHGSLAVELCWVLAPMVIVFMLVWPTVKLFGWY